MMIAFRIFDSMRAASVRRASFDRRGADSFTRRRVLTATVRATPRASKGRKRRREKDLQENLERLEAQLTQLSVDLDLDTPAVSAEPKQPPVVETPSAGGTSKGDKRPFSIQRFKSSSPSSFFNQTTFQDAGLSAELQEALKTIDITRPSQIQGLALEAFSELGFKQSFLLADQAGSGKTLAYLLPLIQKLRFEESSSGTQLTTPHQPRAIVVVPTQELAAQVLQLSRSISKSCPFRCVALTGGRPWATQADFLKAGVDMAICTPKRLLSHLQEGTMTLENCHTMVLDEVDILLGDGFDFRESLMTVLQFVLAETQFFLVTATLPEHTYQLLSETFRELTFIVGPGLHCTAPGVVEQLVDCSGGEVINEDTGQVRKAEALLPLIQSQKGTSQRTVIFCNKIETCRKVENHLKRKDRGEKEFVVLPYHSAIDSSHRKANLAAFLKEKETQHVILVATDRASRGLDTSGTSHVILFDFPRDPSEYVRRVGRAARGAEEQGLVSVLVLGRQVQRAKSVLARSKKGMPIHRIPEAS